ncbi:MAG: ATP-binding protein [Neisseria sp.]|nr:ATP-binding protein [Neisseria sp.]
MTWVSVGDTVGAAFNYPPLEKQAHCDRHGIFESKCYTGDVWTRCPQCEAEASAAEDARKADAEKAARLSAWRRKVDDAGIPPRFTEKHLQNFIADTPRKQEALAFAQDYADDWAAVLQSGRCAMFVGRCGTGKTHLAAGIGLRVMNRHGATVLFTTTLRAIRRIKDSWRKGGETESEAVKALVTPDLLILDEIGVQFGSETEQLILFDVLNERYEKRKPCILISNLPVADVKAYLGERITDRLREDGGAFVPFDWESFRG